MKTSERGRKHVCPECKVKYYDLKKEVIACPICGAKPPAAEAPKAAQPGRRAGRAAFGRFP